MHGNAGKNLSEEHKRKISEALKGKHHSEETKKKLSESLKEQYLSGKRKAWQKGTKGILIAWNKGLTKETDSRIIQYSLKGSKTVKKQYVEGRIHSKGMLGKKAWNKDFTKEDHPNLKGNTQKGRIVWNTGKTKEEFPQLKGNQQSRSEDTLRKSSESHIKYFQEHPEARIRQREVRARIILPKKDTIPEKLAQQALTDLKIEFTKHKSILGQPDIFIEPNICIFIDGDYWHNTEKAIKRDTEVNQELKKQGYKVFRFWEHEIKNQKPRKKKQNLVLI